MGVRLARAAVGAGERRRQLDERSTHFVLRDEAGNLAGAVRLCPAPFELTGLAPGLRSADSVFRDCLEIGRLVCDRRSGDALLALRLLTVAGEWAAAQPGCAGLIAVCTRLRVRVFRRYGMKPVNGTAYLLEDRPSVGYHLLHGALAESPGGGRTMP